MVFGFAAAFAGDWMLVVRGSPTGSPGLLAGVGFFALAHVLWAIGQLKERVGTDPAKHAFYGAFRDFNARIVSSSRYDAGVAIIHAMPLPQ